MHTRAETEGGSVAPPGAWHPELPVEQFARSRSTRFQIGFARMTMHLMPALEDVVLEATDEGLRIVAASELALALPGELIRQIHADEVEVGEPQVRCLQGETVLEPVMWVRATTGRARTECVLHDLIARDAQIEEVDWLACRPTIRAKAWLRRLLGYPAVLRELAGRTAELSMWLAHYAPVPPAPVPPDPGRAA